MFFKKKKTKLDTSEEEEDDVTWTLTHQLQFAREAKKCVDKLRKFFVQEDNGNSPSGMSFKGTSICQPDPH